MKIKFNLLLMAAILFMTTAIAQTPKSELLAGTWKLESLQPKFPDNVTEKQKAKGEKIIAGDEKDFKKTEFVFTKDGKMTVGGKKFVWSMNSDGTRVTVKRNHKTAISATVLELTDHKLVFTRPDEGMIVTYTLSR